MAYPFSDVSMQLLPHYIGLPAPSYATVGSSGIDLHAAIDDSITIDHQQQVVISTGLVLAIPDGLEGQVRPRSGLAVKYGITILNAPGTIDSDYRGEIKVPLYNLGRKEFTITRGMRIAQLVITPYVRANLKLAKSLGETERGTDGFGSTGL